jgi:glutaredoxin
MTQICPKCSYIRKASDTCPDWQCPACQVVYTKAGETLPMKSAGANNVKMHHEGSAIPASTWKWLIVLVILGGVAWQSRSTSRLKAAHHSAAGATVNQGQPAVILYGTSWCGYCEAARRFFDANGIAYTDLDVEKTIEGSEGHKKLGGGGVPVIVIGDQTMHGYNEAELHELLAPWLRGR